MAGLFTVDGVSYKVRVPAGGLTRSFQVLDGKNAGRLLSGTMERDIIGTFYNYQLQIEREGASLESTTSSMKSSPLRLASTLSPSHTDRVR